MVGGKNTIHLTIPWCVSGTDSGFSLGGIHLLGISVWGGCTRGSIWPGGLISWRNLATGFQKHSEEIETVISCLKLLSTIHATQNVHPRVSPCNLSGNSSIIEFWTRVNIKTSYKQKLALDLLKEEEEKKKKKKERARERQQKRNCF